MSSTLTDDDGFLIKYPELLEPAPLKTEKVLFSSIAATAEELLQDIKPRITLKPTVNIVENNGGKTDYYALPLPDKVQLYNILEYAREPSTNINEVVNLILNLCPQTLNDLIEFKKMEPWQHEVIKANYALKARAVKNGGSMVREINKIIYYAERGKALALKEEQES